jgi:hypothetical protein
MRDLNRFGLTSAVDAGGGFQNYPDDYATTDTLARRGELTLRIPYYLFAQKGGQELQDYGKWIALVDLEHQDDKLLEQGYALEGGGENLVAAGADFENFRVSPPATHAGHGRTTERSSGPAGQEPLALPPPRHLRRVDHPLPGRDGSGKRPDALQRPALVL